MSTTVTIKAPIAGRVLAMADVPDPVFSEHMLGPGLAVDPPKVPRLDVYAPVDGTVRTVLPHAVAIQTTAGHGVLVHLGLERVDMEGTDFVLSVSTGEVVETGQHLISWSPRDKERRSVITAVVALQAEPEQLDLLATPEDEVGVGDPLYTWTKPPPAERA